MHKHLIVISAALLALTGCGMGADHSMSDDMSSLQAKETSGALAPDPSLTEDGMMDDAMSGMVHEHEGAVGEVEEGSEATAGAGAIGTLNSAELMFLEHMIPHHQQAVDMATLALTRSHNAAVTDLATNILTGQAREISTMTAWLGKAPDTSMHADGMLSLSQMLRLRLATGASFDRLFLTGMIYHHTGAVAMASEQLKSANSTFASFASGIVTEQTAQIGTMNELLKKL